MSPRKADESVTLETTVDQVHTHDIVHKGGVRFLIEGYRRFNLRRTLTVRNLTFATQVMTCAWDMNHVVFVQLEHSCECGGTGMWSWGGSVNGVPVHTGVHFRCDGKGWQDRADVVRNYNYDNYAVRV